LGGIEKRRLLLNRPTDWNSPWQISSKSWVLSPAMLQWYKHLPVCPVIRRLAILQVQFKKSEEAG
jgi:hypothetical protein